MPGRFETIREEFLDDGLLRILLDRPAAANAMNTQMGRDLLAAFSELNADPRKVRCIVLSGSGQRAFCAGGDLKERNTMSDEQWQAQHHVFEQMIASIIECPIPIVAAVNGAAFGGGLEIALGCDFIYASRSARFALTEVTLGIMPGCAGTQNLPRAVGERRAKELILSGLQFTAEEAYAWGLVNRVCEPDELADNVLAAATRIARNAPIAVRQAKQSIHCGLEQSLANGMRFEIQAYNRLIPTQDRREGIAAFNEKRAPGFKGI